MILGDARVQWTGITVTLKRTVIVQGEICGSGRIFVVELEGFVSA